MKSMIQEIFHYATGKTIFPDASGDFNGVHVHKENIIPPFRQQGQTSHKTAGG
jgi:hypothetical protein